MKKVYILTVLLACLLVGCKNDRILYEGGTYLLFDLNQTSYVIKEDNNVIEVPIALTRALPEALTITISSVNDSTTTAVEGYDFEIVDKTVTIPAGQFAATIKVRALLENLTQEGVTVKLQYGGVSEDLVWNIYGNTVEFEISEFFEVTMEWLVGNWTMTDYNFADDSFADEYTITISQVSEDTIAIYNVWDGAHTIQAVVDAQNAQIVILEDQVIYLDSRPQYGEVYMLAYDGSGIYIQNLIGSCTSRSISIEGWCAYTYLGGGTFGRYYSSLVKN